MTISLTIADWIDANVSEADRNAAIAYAYYCRRALETMAEVEPDRISYGIMPAGIQIPAEVKMVSYDASGDVYFDGIRQPTDEN